jgi:hypothetical protein
MNAEFMRAHAALLALGEARSLHRTATAALNPSAAIGPLNRAESAVQKLADEIYDLSRPEDVPAIRRVLEKFADLALERDQHVALGDYARDKDGAPLLWWHSNVACHSIYSLLCKAENELELDAKLPRDSGFPGGASYAAHLRNKGPAFYAFQLLQRYVITDEWRWRLSLPHRWLAERVRAFGQKAPIPKLLAGLHLHGEL